MNYRFKIKIQNLLFYKRKILLPSLFILLLSFFAFAAKNSSLHAEQPPGETWTIYFQNLKGKEVELYCEVARTEKEKLRGLMFRKKLDPNGCMIFLYEKPLILSFWMKNTEIPLSIAFVNEQFRLMEIYDMKPFDESVISSTTYAMYAMETNRGWFRKHYIYPGSVAKVEKIDVRQKSN